MTTYAFEGVAVPQPQDSYFTITEAKALVTSTMRFITTSATHCKDDSYGFGQVHRVDSGRVVWTLTPDPNVEGMFLFETTTGLVVIAPWDAKHDKGEPPSLVACLVDAETAIIRARYAIDTTQQKASSHAVMDMTLGRRPSRSPHTVFVRSRVDWGNVCVDFEADGGSGQQSLPLAFGVPVLSTRSAS